MSTRCQVEVTSSGLEWKDSVMLYHHCDGYPSNMLPLIYEAYKTAVAPGKYGSSAWEAGRPGKAASFLCAADPGQFEPESGDKLHGDIEWFYVVECVNSKGGSMAEVPTWNVKVFTPNGSGFWDKPVRKSLKLVAEGEISDLAKRADKIESAA